MYIYILYNYIEILKLPVCMKNCVLCRWSWAPSSATASCFFEGACCFQGGHIIEKCITTDLLMNLVNSKFLVSFPGHPYQRLVCLVKDSSNLQSCLCKGHYFPWLFTWIFLTWGLIIVVIILGCDFGKGVGWGYNSKS